MVHRSITDKLAHSMLTDYGVSIIWKLHNDAATLYRVGNSVAAESFLSIAPTPLRTSGCVVRTRR